MNNEKIMFSVEVTTYNQKEYIAQTLQSIIDQEHNYKYEILVSDDCSTDGTQDIIKEFQKEYPDIIKPVYNKKNLGPMANYYATILRAKGKYLMGCGGDDYWLPGKVQKQIDFLEKNTGFVLCHSRAHCYDNESKKYNGYVGSSFIDQNDILLKANCVAALTACIRRDFLLKYINDIQPENKNWLMEDYPLYIYAFLESYVYFMPEYLAVYRVLENSVSHQINPKKQYNFEKSVYDIRLFYSERYGIKIEKLDDKDFYNIIKKSDHVKKKELNSLRKELGLSKDKKIIFKIIKKILKFILPYGLIILFQNFKTILIRGNNESSNIK